MLVAERDGATEEDLPVHVTAATELLRAAGGDAEPINPGTVVAGFDDPATALAAAMRLHARADLSAAVWRVGLHVAEILMTAEGSEMRDAIDRATELAQAARPGTTALTGAGAALAGPVPDADLELLDTRGLPALPEGPVYLVVPRATAGDAVGRRKVVIAIAGTIAVGMGATAVGIATRRYLAPPERHPLTLGVLNFHLVHGGEQDAWIGTALRDGLSSQLSQLSGVKVYSQEFLDFLVTRERLTDVEAASRLGIEKMVTGSVFVLGDTIRVEVRIVDVGSGVVEGAHTAVGRESLFLALEVEVLEAAAANLRLSLSPDDEERLHGRRTTDSDALRRLLEAEGGDAPAPRGPPPDGRDPQSLLWDALGPRRAWADEADADRARIIALLDAYRRAIEARDVDAVGALYAAFPAAQRDAVERFFAAARDIRVRIENVDVAVVGSEAVVSFSRTDDFVDVPTGRPQRVTVRLTKRVRRIDGAWRFASGRP